jgi:hypothetical protein
MNIKYLGHIIFPAGSATIFCLLFFGCKPLRKRMAQLVVVNAL